jgi:hypothetical protein
MTLLLTFAVQCSVQKIRSIRIQIQCLSNYPFVGTGQHVFTKVIFLSAYIHVLMLISCQYRNMTTVLTREYLDVRPDGWLDYAAKRIAQL